MKAVDQPSDMPHPEARAIRDVLVVDDSRLQRRIVAALLKKWGYAVREAESGEEALLTRFLTVSDPTRTVVCYTQGHGEPAFDSLEPYNGYAHLRDLLREANLEVRPAELDRPAAEAGEASAG